MITVSCSSCSIPVTLVTEQPTMIVFAIYFAFGDFHRVHGFYQVINAHENHDGFCNNKSKYFGGLIRNFVRGNYFGFR